MTNEGSVQVTCLTCGGDALLADGDLCGKDSGDMCLRGARICVVCERLFIPQEVKWGSHFWGGKKRMMSRRLTCSDECKYVYRGRRVTDARWTPKDTQTGWSFEVDPKDFMVGVDESDAGGDSSE